MFEHIQLTRVQFAELNEQAHPDSCCGQQRVLFTKHVYPLVSADEVNCSPRNIAYLGSLVSNGMNGGDKRTHFTEILEQVFGDLLFIFFDSSNLGFGCIDPSSVDSTILDLLFQPYIGLPRGGGEIWFYGDGENFRPR